MVEKPGKLQPALVGGIITGLGSVTPFLAYGNLCCCLWAIIGGAVAARMLIKRSPALPVTKGEGASAGMLAGVVGSLVYLMIGVPITLMGWDTFIGAMLSRSDNIGDPAARESFRHAVEFMQSHALLSGLLIWLIFGILTMGFATLGGIIGVAIFEKRKGEPYPPQWPPPGDYPPPGFAPPGPPPGGPTPPPGQSPYGGGDPPPY